MYVGSCRRFWFRWAIIQVSERLSIPPPIFRPRIAEWDAWLFKHTRSRELHSRIVLLHKVGPCGPCGQVALPRRWACVTWRFGWAETRGANTLHHISAHSPVHCHRAICATANPPRRVHKLIHGPFRALTQQ